MQDTQDGSHFMRRPELVKSLLFNFLSQLHLEGDSGSNSQRTTIMHHFNFIKTLYWYLGKGRIQLLLSAQLCDMQKVGNKQWIALLKSDIVYGVTSRFQNQITSFKSQLCLTLVLRSLAGQFTSLSFKFLFCKVKIMIGHDSQNWKEN